MRDEWDCVIVGAGAAGLFAGIEAGRRGRRVLVVDHARAPAEKIRISGGGRCNFTNLNTEAERFLSANTHFAKSALSRFTPADFVARVEAHGIAYHEKTLGQLFCDQSSRDIIDMLLAELRESGAELRLGLGAKLLGQGDGFRLDIGGAETGCGTLVVATGGKSIPKMGATGWGYDVAERFGLAIEETRPGLVPLTFSGALQERMKGLTGVSSQVRAFAGEGDFEEAMLFTHRGLSGPAILQISSYWREGAPVEIAFLEPQTIVERLREVRSRAGRQSLGKALGGLLPARLLEDRLAGLEPLRRVADLSDTAIRELAEATAHWRILPSGTEGYRTAEVTLGGVSTAALNARNMEAKAVPGLFFVGEVVDVTGWLGGYNFQWAWASGWAAGQVC